MTSRVSPKKPEFKQKYDRLLQDLRSGILSGRLEPDTYLPSENQLADDYQISRSSVRKVIAELAREDLVQTIHGRGSIVNAPPQQVKQVSLQMIWSIPSLEYPMIEQLVAEFNQEQPHIHVNVATYDSSAYFQDSLLGVQPDVLFYTNGYLHVLSQGADDLFMPLDELGLTEDLQRCYTHLVDEYKLSDRIYGVPVTFSPVVLAYNKDIFAQMGIGEPKESWTWSDLLQAAQMLTHRKEELVEHYGFVMSSPSDRWLQFVFQNGGAFVEQGRFIRDNPRVFEAVKFIHDLIYKYKVCPVYPMSSPNEGESFFKQGKAAMVMTSHYFMDQFNEAGMNWDFIPFPSNRRVGSMITSTAVGIGKHSKNRSAAIEFIRYFLSEPVQAKIKQRSFAIPSRMDVAQFRSYPHPEFPGHGYYSFEKVIHYGYSLKDIGLTPDQFKMLNSLMPLVWSNLESIEQVWEQLAAAFRQDQPSL